MGRKYQKLGYSCTNLGLIGVCSTGVTSTRIGTQALVLVAHVHLPLTSKQGCGHGTLVSSKGSVGACRLLTGEAMKDNHAHAFLELLSGVFKQSVAFLGDLCGTVVLLCKIEEF